MTQFIIYPEDNTVRGFKNPDLAFRWARQNPDIIYASPMELRSLPAEFMEAFGTYEPDLLWEALKDVADWVDTMPPWEKQKEQGQVSKLVTYHIDLEQATYLSTNGHHKMEYPDMRTGEMVDRKLPKQMLAIVDLLIYHDAMILTEEELKILLLDRRFMRQAKSRQKPWRLFRYYRKTLIWLKVLRVD